MLNLLASTFKDKSFFVQMLCSDEVSSNVCLGTSQWSLVSNSRQQNEPGLGLGTSNYLRSYMYAFSFSCTYMVILILCLYLHCRIKLSYDEFRVYALLLRYRNSLETWPITNVMEAYPPFGLAYFQK